MLPLFGSETERRRIEDRAGRRFARGAGIGVLSGGLFAPVLYFRCYLRRLGRSGSEGLVDDEDLGLPLSVVVDQLEELGGIAFVV